jgi:hypothetical protein
LKYNQAFNLTITGYERYLDSSLKEMQVQNNKNKKNLFFEKSNQQTVFLMTNNPN